MNLQPTKDLQQFQKLILQDMYIKKLNQWLDEMEWENEKKDALVEMLEKEIDDLKKSVQTEIERRNKTENQFKIYVKKIKESKVDIQKDKKQQAIIADLRHQLTSAQKRLEVSHRLNTLLTRQK